MLYHMAESSQKYFYHCIWSFLHKLRYRFTLYDFKFFFEIYSKEIFKDYDKPRLFILTAKA